MHGIPIVDDTTQCRCHCRSFLFRTTFHFITTYLMFYYFSFISTLSTLCCEVATKTETRWCRTNGCKTELNCWPLLSMHHALCRCVNRRPPGSERCSRRGWSCGNVSQIKLSTVLLLCHLPRQNIDTKFRIVWSRVKLDACLEMEIIHDFSIDPNWFITENMLGTQGTSQRKRFIWYCLPDTEWLKRTQLILVE